MLYGDKLTSMGSFFEPKILDILYRPLWYSASQPLADNVII
jgi:hypothetical protein